ncbi:MAG: C-GCAxxG-C-C family protein [Verrucomicrobiae bacterium]|nr:C-GCAxxG-C-C family protein [Verrucomicrobiae bacterium]
MKIVPEQVAARAEDLFQAGFCCAESVFAAVAEGCGIRSELIPKVATGFCGGMARTGNVCGAVTGAVMGISLATGRTSPNGSRETNHKLTQQLMREFEARFGTIICRELIGCRLDTPEGHKHFIEHGLRAKCAEFTRQAARMAAEALQRDRLVQEQSNER